MSYYRAKERNRRLKKQHDKFHTIYTAGIWYSEDEERYIKCDAPRRRKYLRNQANRRVRRTKHFSGNYGDYKKVYDLQWNID